LSLVDEYLAVAIVRGNRLADGTDARATPPAGASG
jgi:hypothetical protein